MNDKYLFTHIGTAGSSSWTREKKKRDEIRTQIFDTEYLLHVSTHFTAKILTLLTDIPIGVKINLDLACERRPKPFSEHKYGGKM